MASRAPRVAMLLRLFTSLVVPQVTVVILNKFSSTPLSTVWLALACPCSVLLAFVARVQIRDLWQRWEARRMGAIRPPRVKGKWPGNIDLVLEQYDAFINDYFGESLSI